MSSIPKKRDYRKNKYSSTSRTTTTTYLARASMSEMKSNELTLKKELKAQNIDVNGVS